MDTKLLKWQYRQYVGESQKIQLAGCNVIESVPDDHEQNCKVQWQEQCHACLFTASGPTVAIKFTLILT